MSWYPISGYPSKFLEKSVISPRLPHRLGFLPAYLRNGITQRKTISITNGLSIRKTDNDKEGPHLLEVPTEEHAGFNSSTTQDEF